MDHDGRLHREHLRTWTIEPTPCDGVGTNPHRRRVGGPDPVTVDLVSGTVMAAVRRLISLDAPLDDANRDAIPDVVARLLEAIGIDGNEARSLAAAAHHAERTPSAHDGATA